AHVEGLVVDKEPNDLAVRDVEDRLPRLREPVGHLGVGERPDLVERIQIRARDSEGLPLVQVRTQADVPVREREDRFRLREHVEVEVRLAHAPGPARERWVGDHFSGPNSAPRSSRTMSAPCSSTAPRCPTRPPPPTNPNLPPRPASTPASASSKTAASP